MLLQAVMKKEWKIGGIGVASIPEGAGVYVMAKIEGSRFPNGGYVVVCPEMSETSSVPADHLEFMAAGSSLGMYLTKIPTIPQFGPVVTATKIYRVHCKKGIRKNVVIQNEVQNEGIYRNLMQQIEKISSHVKKGCVETRFRYGEAVDRFCQFISDEFRVQKFTNVKEKHVVEYVKHMQGKGLSASTIKTDLSAIRFYYDQAGGKNELPTNYELGKAFGQ